MAREIAIAFTDLVESTAISSRVGAERAELLRIAHFRLLRAAVRPHLGREVKNLGDGMMLAFPSAAEAVAGGVAIQQAFDARHRTAPDEERLEIRVGIACGEAFEEDGDFFGAPVVEAARLCGIAAGGEILVGARVLELAGRHDVDALGARHLKGMAEPVDVFAVRWTPLPDDDEPALARRRCTSAPTCWSTCPRG